MGTLIFPVISRLSCGLIILFSSLLHSSIEDYYKINLEPTSSNYGITGLMEIPSARFMPEGTLKLGISASYPNEFTFLAASPFPWFEATYRYLEEKTEKYGPFGYSGNQTLKDKGFDIKIRVLEESYFLPNVAIGITDMAGSGRFASEYISTSKKFNNLDVTLGLGWGVLGSDRNIRNPLISLSPGFEDRGGGISEKGGTFNVKDWFSGDKAALFAGLEYSLHRYGLNLKLEYDTSNPGLGINRQGQEVKSRFNFGLVTTLGEVLDLGLSFERGTQVRFSFVVKTNYSKSLVPKLDPPLNVIPLSSEQISRVVENKDTFFRSLNLSLRDERIYIQGATFNDDSVDVVINQSRFRSYPRAIGRTARVTSALSPDNIEEINVFVMNGDVDIASVSLNRKEFDKALNNQSTSSEVLNYSSINPPGNTPKYTTTEFKPRVLYPEFFWTMTPALRHQIGGPEAFYLGQLWWKVSATAMFRRGLSLSTVIGFDIYNNFDEFANPSQSKINRVRSDIQEYLSKGESNIARMHLSYIWSPYKDLFAKVDFGLFEEMFGGFGGEIFYRPFDSDFSTSFSLHKVKQRGFKQRFKFRDYETETGFLGLHYDFPKGIHSQVLIGKYLAGDKGATFDISRRLRTGFTLGVFATKTNLSKELFGEGSFDKGFYFSIPTEMFYTKYRTGDIAFGMQPLTKDGGARPNIYNSLYNLYGGTNRDSLIRDWDDLLD